MSFNPVESFATRLPAYLQEVRAANSEPGRALAFLHLLRSTFEGVQAGSPGALVPLLEKRVTIHDGSLLAVGRIDALLGNLVIEFKLELNPRPLRDAVDQLKRYVSALWTVESRHRNYMLIATDGIRFRVYSPSGPSESGSVEPTDVTVDEVNELDLSTSAADEAYRWLDRYLLWRERVSPTAEGVLGDFGRESPAFAAGLRTLREGWTVAGPASSAPYTEWRRYLSVVYGSESGDASLFLRHTYLATLAKLMVYTYYSSGAIPSKEKTREILDGNAFREWGIDNFLEEDFFSWVSKPEAKGSGLALADILIRVLERYDLTKLDGDVLKGLYEGLVDPEDRHDLGEYYTPDWLAERVVRKLEVSVDERVLDPACGSGTFLVVIIRRKRDVFRRDSTGSLDRIISSVVGVDVHPLAVLVSKANYLLALGDLVKSRPGRLVVPVYLANSIDFPSAITEIQHGTKAYRYPVDLNTSLGVPEEVVAKNIEGPVIDSITTYSREVANGQVVDSRARFDRRLLHELGPGLSLSDGALATLWDTARTLKRLIVSNRDSIFAFIVKNVYRPSKLKGFDVLVGNPPWLSYRYIRVRDYQKSIKRLILQDHRLLDPKDTRLLTHMELATLFMVRCSKLFLRDGGRVGFVMPRSVFTADQHARFREGAFRPDFRVTGIDDFDHNQQDRLTPVFSVESCVIYAARDGTTTYPVPCVQFSGSLPGRKTSYKEFERSVSSHDVTQAARQVALIHVGERSAWSYDATDAIDALRVGRSPYASSFRQGGTIVPRPFWFVRPVAHPRFGLDPGAPYLESTPHSVQAAKQGWAPLTGQVESRFLFATLLGEDLLPFCHRPFRLLALPAVVGDADLSVLDSGQLASAGFPMIRSWVLRAEESWRKVRGTKADKMSLRKRLDNQRGLSDQAARPQRLVLYNTSGRRNLCACVLEVPEHLALTIEGKGIAVTGFVAESSTYFSPITSEDEGYYLTAILNSEYVFDLVQKIKATRHVHKKVWELPIPKFDPKYAHAATLAALGHRATEAAISSLDRLVHHAGSSTGSLRGKLRREIRRELALIEPVVESIISK